MADDYLSFDDALSQLQMQEAELRALVSQGKLRAFRDENTLKFRRTDVETLRRERETGATVVLSPGDMSGLDTQTDFGAAAPLDEEPIDLLADEVLDYDDTAETIIGSEFDVASGDTELTLDDSPTAIAGEPGTKVPTIELTPATGDTDETAVPTLELGDDIGIEEIGSETEVPTMVLGLDEYDDTQVATEEVATEEVFLEDGDLEDAPVTADIEEPIMEPDEEEEAERAIGSITGSSSYGTGEPLAVREQPSALYTVMSALAAIILIVPGSVFFYCIATQKVPDWEILQDIIKFFWEKLEITL